MPASVAVRKLEHRYGATPVVTGLSFLVEAGEIACLLGPSGCGKTTVLRCLAGFEEVRSGEILIGGRTVSRPGLHVPPEQRGVGMVFQEYALFPHLSVERNVAFGLGRLTPDAARRRTGEMLELVGLADAARVYPHELSGGQQQRVAIARALAPAPDLLLLDEPFSNLDVDLRERLTLEIRSILKAAGATVILVTHDQHEAFALADTIGVLHDGAIEQWDTPHNLYHRPRTRFVADFVGEGVFLQATADGRGSITTELGALEVAWPVVTPAPTSVELLVRPDDIVHDDGSPALARVVGKAFRGAHFLYTLELPSGTRVISLVPSHHDHALGERIGIRLAIDDVVAFPMS